MYKGIISIYLVNTPKWGYSIIFSIAAAPVCIPTKSVPGF